MLQRTQERLDQHRHQQRNERMLQRTQEKLVEYLTKDLTKAVLDVYCEVKMKGKTDKKIFFYNADTWCAKMNFWRAPTGFRINTTTLVRPHPQPGKDRDALHSARGKILLQSE